MRLSLVLVVALFGSPVALAQEAGTKPSAANSQAKLVKDKEAQSFNEIERGFYIGVGGGGWMLVNPPSGDPAQRTFSPGLSIQVEIGGDLGSRVSIAAHFIAAFNKMGAGYRGYSEGAASGDFSSFMPGVTARVNVVGFDDSQEVRRWWLFVRAGGSVTLYAPKTLFTTPSGTERWFDLMFYGGPGIEYYTRLRHFSIALEADFVFQILSQTIGFNIMPTLRYAF
jgi:hypothetical protein